MQLILCLLSNFYLNMFRASLCPSSGEQECTLPHMVTFTVHTARVPAPHNHSHHNQCRTPCAAVHTLVLQTMGIMMPETCWDKSLIINIRLVASCWFHSLHRLFPHAFISNDLNLLVTVLVLNGVCLLQTGEVHNFATSPGNYNRFVLTRSMSCILIWLSSCQTLFCQILPGDKTRCFQYDLESNQ